MGREDVTGLYRIREAFEADKLEYFNAPSIADWLFTLGFFFTLVHDETGVHFVVLHPSGEPANLNMGDWIVELVVSEDLRDFEVLSDERFREKYVEMEGE